MRKESKHTIETNIQTVAYYHGSHFNQLSFYNSDRKFKVNVDRGQLVVSPDNTASALKIKKEGTVCGGYGLEIENSCEVLMDNANCRLEGYTVYKNLLDMIFANCKFDSDFFRIEQDSTTGVRNVCLGAEAVTQCASSSAIRNMYPCFKALFDDYFKRFMITTDNGRCGMHVNISSCLFGNPENIRKFGYFVNHHFDLCKVLFNRKNTEWCGNMGDNLNTWKTRTFSSFPTHSGACVNFEHLDNDGIGRVEVRLVGGHGKFATFRNTMETIFFMVDRVKSASWDVLESPALFFKGCNLFFHI